MGADPNLGSPWPYSASSFQRRVAVGPIETKCYDAIEANTVQSVWRDGVRP